MRSFEITVTVEVDNELDADRMADEIRGRLQDASESSDFPQLEFDVGMPVEIDVPGTLDPVEEFYREKAADTRQKDGDIEFDPGAAVSIGDDNGAYVQAWVWIDGPPPKEDDGESAADSEGGDCD